MAEKLLRFSDEDLGERESERQQTQALVSKVAVEGEGERDKASEVAKV